MPWSRRASLTCVRASRSSVGCGRKVNSSMLSLYLGLDVTEPARQRLRRSGVCRNHDTPAKRTTHPAEPLDGLIGFCGGIEKPLCVWRDIEKHRAPVRLAEVWVLPQ